MTEVNEEQRNLAAEIEEEQKEKKEEKDKKHVDDLWADFMKDVGQAAKPRTEIKPSSTPASLTSSIKVNLIPLQYTLELRFWIRYFFIGTTKNYLVISSICRRQHQDPYPHHCWLRSQKR